MSQAGDLPSAEKRHCEGGSKRQDNLFHGSAYTVQWQQSGFKCSTSRVATGKTHKAGGIRAKFWQMRQQRSHDGVVPSQECVDTWSVD